jgi:hypothetical protein
VQCYLPTAHASNQCIDRPLEPPAETCETRSHDVWPSPIHHPAESRSHADVFPPSHPCAEESYLRPTVESRTGPKWRGIDVPARRCICTSLC